MSWIKSFLSGVGKIFKPVEEKAISDFEAKVQALGPQGLQLAEDAITWAASSAPGGDKVARDAAKQKFTESAKGSGIDLRGWAGNEFNALIELVYIGVKPTVAAVAAPTTNAATPPAILAATPAATPVNA